MVHFFENQLLAQYIHSPLGELLSIFSEKGLCLLQFTDLKTLDKDIQHIEKQKGLITSFKKNTKADFLQQEIEQYFDRKQTQFATSLDLIGSDFQQKVWNILKNIPYGHTISYKKQSQLYGDEKSVRAIASANGKNKISILIPCHRVIGNNGKLVGYAGGLYRKKVLLEIENPNYSLFSELLQ